MPVFKKLDPADKTYFKPVILLPLLSKWQKELDSSGIVVTILMDLSKAYDCLQHDLILAAENKELTSNPHIVIDLRFFVGFLKDQC